MLSVATSLANAAWSLRRGRVAGANPWDADTLEWATASPPSPANFDAPVQPVVSPTPLLDAPANSATETSAPGTPEVTA